MKTYRRQILLVSPIGAILGLLLLASFTNEYDACKFANTNTIYIKDETLLAFEASDLKIVKYHAYKALTGIERAKANFEDCGCDVATKSIDRTKTNLKNATKSPSISDAKTFVHIALKNTDISINALENFKENSNSSYEKTYLSLNTKPAELPVDDIIAMEGNTLVTKIENGALKFKKSLDMMIATNNCAEALDYVEETYELSARKSRDTSISPGKRNYHKRIKEITSAALEKLGDCN